MAENHTISNVWMAYIQNNPYVYPNDNASIYSSDRINTGWHIIPNMLWKHLVTPKQWHMLTINYEAYHVCGIKATIFNCVPMTTQLAIQGTNVFSAFNNSIYGMGYKDELYETSWYNYFAYTNNDPHNLLYKEGLAPEYGTNNKKRVLLPIYEWHMPNSRANNKCTYDSTVNAYSGANEQSGVFPVPSGDGNHFRPGGIIWDPLNRSEEIMELRPGKNAVSFSWEAHPCDSDKWFNIDLLSWWYPYVPESPYHSHRQRPGSYKFTEYCEPDRLATRYETSPATNDYTIPNYANIPVVPMAWWWHEIKSAVPATVGTDWNLKYIDLFFQGTEYEKYKYGPTQWFVKMLPIFDDNNTHVMCTAQISVKTELYLKCKKRRSAIFAPTWGPFNWKQLYAHNSADQLYFPSMIRYRSGGAKRTWQNFADSQSKAAHPRATVYDTGHTQGGGEGICSTGLTRTTATATYSKGTKPSAPPAPKRERYPTPYPPPEPML